MKPIHVKRTSLPLLPLLGLAAALVVFLSYGYGAVSKVQATDPNLEFDMAVTSGGTGTCDTTGIDPHVKGAAVCNVAVGTAFTVEVHLTSPGAQSGNVGGVQTMIGWTAGLIGPGDPSSTKAVAAVNCPGFSATAAPFIGVPHSAAAACAAGIGVGGILTDAQATGFIGRFVLNCTAAPSQQSVTMLVTPDGGTVVADAIHFTFHADKDGSEVLTIACGTRQIKKDPPLANLWLCQPVATCANADAGIGERDFHVNLNSPITSLSPKGEAQTIGSFEFEVRYDSKFVSVEVVAGPLFEQPHDRGSLRSDVQCLTIPTQNAVQFRCNIKGKPTDAPVGPGTLAIVKVKPTADVYSMLIPNQGNGIATQLINQGCQLSDLQGHPINTAICGDAELTIRYLEGDVNADCVVNVQDQQQIAFRWGSHLGSLLYNSRFDLEPAAPKKGDGDIDAKDLQVVWGRHNTIEADTCIHPHAGQDPVDPKAIPTKQPTPTPAPQPTP